MDTASAARDAASLGASGAADASLALEGLVWMGVVLVIVGLALLLLRGVRRRLIGATRVDELGGGLSLGELRRHREAGLLTQAEFEAVRRRIAASWGAHEPSQPSQPSPTSDKLFQRARGS